MRTTRTMLLAAAIAAALCAPAAIAQPVIDDFETGSFQLANSTPGSPSGASPAVSAPAHAIASPRNVQIDAGFSGLPAMTAEVQAGSEVDDGLKIAFGPGGGNLLLWYHVAPSSFDLSGGGANDRIEIRIPVATPGAGIQVNAWDLFGSSASFGMGVGLGVHRFYFSDLAPVDFAFVKRLEIRIVHFIEGSLHVADIRAMRENSRWLLFDIPVEIAAGPPFPLDPFHYTVTDATPSDVQSIRLMSATKTATGGAAGLALTAMDSGSDTDAGDMGHVGVSWNEAGTPFAATGFDLRVDISGLSGVEPQPFLPALPVATPTPTGFMLSFELFHPAETAGEARITERQILFDALPGQDLAFDEVRVHAVGAAPHDAQAADGEPPAAFRVTFDLKPAGSVDAGEPLFEIALTGTCRPAGTTAVAEIGGATGQSLTAVPGVTRSGADLRLARPAGAPGRIELFDVLGRRVRSLLLARGEPGRHWDGRDAAGRLTAAGLYFARFTDGAHDLRARIVRIP
jgi:hypothetical protein